MDGQKSPRKIEKIGSPCTAFEKNWSPKNRPRSQCLPQMLGGIQWIHDGIYGHSLDSSLLRLTPDKKSGFILLALFFLQLTVHWTIIFRERKKRPMPDFMIRDGMTINFKTMKISNKQQNRTHSTQGTSMYCSQTTNVIRIAEELKAKTLRRR